jgi:hypothetical protein
MRNAGRAKALLQCLRPHNPTSKPSKRHLREWTRGYEEILSAPQTTGPYIVPHLEEYFQSRGYLEDVLPGGP